MSYQLSPRTEVFVLVGVLDGLAKDCHYKAAEHSNNAVRHGPDFLDSRARAIFLLGQAEAYEELVFRLGGEAEVAGLGDASIEPKELGA